ncbi:MAG: acyl carrier protein [Bacilli bacterium]|nr:acyl carrier protein [Bacilli bacterium]
MEILEVVKDVIKDRINIDSINYDDRLDELGLDSLDLVETMLKIEEAVGVEFTSDEIVELKTIRDVVNLIETKKM